MRERPFAGVSRFRLPHYAATCAISGQMPPTLTLAVQDLACQRAGRLVFEGVNFSLASGEALLVTGANGAGKTSLLRMLAGLLPVHAGRIVGPEGELPLP